MDRFFGFLEEHPLFQFKEEWKTGTDYIFLENETFYRIIIYEKEETLFFPIKYGISNPEQSVTGLEIYDAPIWFKQLLKKANDAYFSKYKLQHVIEHKKRPIENVIFFCLLFEPCETGVYDEVYISDQQVEMPASFSVYESKIVSSIEKGGYKIDRIEKNTTKITMYVK